MTTVRVFINARGHDVAAGSTALDALRIADAEAASQVDAGARQITDSRGLPVAPETPVYGGAIYRIVSNRSRDAELSS